MRRLDLEGQRFGKLVAVRCIRVQGKTRSRIRWECLCDCGTVRLVEASHLVSGRQKSCGRGVHKHGVPLKPLGTAGFNGVINNYKREAAARNYEWSLSDDQAGYLFKSACTYCGKPPSQVSSPYKNRPRSSSVCDYIYNGIDRVDNLRGYTVENSVPCCIRCNKAKSNLTLTDFRNWVAAIHKRFESRVVCTVGA